MGFLQMKILSEISTYGRKVVLYGRWSYMKGGLIWKVVLHERWSYMKGGLIASKT